MLSAQQINNLRAAAQASLECEKSTGVPCELTLAQWALESGWGEHSPMNNCFGIKYYIGAPGGQFLDTMEWMTIEQCQQWLTVNPLRSAKIQSDAPSRGRLKYLCRDQFAAFRYLSECFIKHADLLTRGAYGNFLGTFKASGDLPTYISNVAKVYATDPHYADELMGILHMQEVLAALKEIRGESHMGSVGE